ncbi:MAG: methyltransferase domain-containing protein [bacterium]
MKLHLGCGGTYLDGYVNIDFPPTEKTIMNVKADIYQDITKLEYEKESVDEIRNHHVFEHFNRVDSLKLLFRWRHWLKPGGKLIIETPDYFWCSLLLLITPHKFKIRLGRHIFGTQEDFWANHLDFWYKGKFKKVLSKLGFEKFKFSHPIYRNLLPNIKVECYKSEKEVDIDKVMKEILSWYVLPREDRDKFLKNWLHKN